MEMEIFNTSDSFNETSDIMDEFNQKMDYLWTFAFSSIVLLSILGNLTVMWIVIGHKRMWSSTNYYLLNLTLADILMATLNCIFSFIFMRDGVWNFGLTYCVINHFTSLVTVSASVLTLLAITLDRRRAIMSPLKPKATKMFVGTSITAIWTASCLIALPSTIHTSVFTVVRNESTVELCITKWPDGFQGYSTHDFYYNVFYMALTYLLPLFVMAVCFLQMGRKLWGGEVIGEDTPGLQRSRKNKQKVVKMFGAVITIFGVCWLPYHLYFLYSYYNPGIMKFPYIKHIFLFFYFMAMANCCINPIVYYYMNKRFRDYFNYVILCAPRKLKENVVRLTFKQLGRRSSFSDPQGELIIMRDDLRLNREFGHAGPVPISGTAIAIQRNGILARVDKESSGSFM